MVEMGMTTRRKQTKSQVPTKAAHRYRFSTGPGGETVQEWLANLEPGQRAIAKHFDRLAREELAGVVRAIKWNVPFYGLPGHGWVAAMAALTNYVKVTFFGGADLQPPPVETTARGEGGRTRYLHLASARDIDERQLRSWLRQTRDAEGWGRMQARDSKQPRL
jgi:hypothetical protein